MVPLPLKPVKLSGKLRHPPSAGCNELLQFHPPPHTHTHTLGCLQNRPGGRRGLAATSLWPLTPPTMLVRTPREPGLHCHPEMMGCHSPSLLVWYQRKANGELELPLLHNNNKKLLLSGCQWRSSREPGIPPLPSSNKVTHLATCHSGVTEDLLKYKG